MIQNPNWLLIPYAANIAILIPVCWSLLFSGSTAGVFQGQVQNSDGLRLLVASLYVAILLASLAGLVWPSFFAPVILIQIVYKSIWLAVFVLPLIMKGMPVPVGISASFLAIVISYPVFLWLASK